MLEMKLKAPALITDGNLPTTTLPFRLKLIVVMAVSGMKLCSILHPH